MEQRPAAAHVLDMEERRRLHESVSAPSVGQNIRRLLGAQEAVDEILLGSLDDNIICFTLSRRHVEEAVWQIEGTFRLPPPSAEALLTGIAVMIVAPSFRSSLAI